MRKVLIFSLILALIVLFANNFVFASGVNMNLVNTNTNTNGGTNTNGNDDTVYGTANINQNVVSRSNTEVDTTLASSIGSTAALSETNLSLSNILDIILIVLGILLVLFAIAILIRMH